MRGMLLMPVTPVVRRLRQDNHCKLKASLEYTVNSRISCATEGNPISKKKIYIENRKNKISCIFCWHLWVDIFRLSEVRVSLCDASLRRPRQCLGSGRFKKKTATDQISPKRDPRERCKHRKYTAGISSGRAGTWDGRKPVQNAPEKLPRTTAAGSHWGTPEMVWDVPQEEANWDARNEAF